MKEVMNQANKNEEIRSENRFNLRRRKKEDEGIKAQGKRIEMGVEWERREGGYEDAQKDCEEKYEEEGESLTLSNKRKQNGRKKYVKKGEKEEESRK